MIKKDFVLNLLHCNAKHGTLGLCLLASLVPSWMYVVGACVIIWMLIPFPQFGKFKENSPPGLILKGMHLKAAREAKELVVM